MQIIRGLSFDLDDTLWPVGPVIARAEQVTHTWLCQNYPAVCERFDQEKFRTLRRELIDSHPEISHDLTRVRERSLEIAFEQSGLDRAGVGATMAVFLTARNDVEPYPESVAALKYLSGEFRLLALSNGNADINKTPLASYFSGAVSAAEAGCAKPDPRIFQLACDRLGLEPGAVLHVGDHPSFDVLGARDAGMQSMWINRTGEPWPHTREPDFRARNLTEAVDLLSGQFNK